MDFSERIELLHHVADMIRHGGDIDINHQGELELRSATVAERVLRKISYLTGIESEDKFKISKGALPQVSYLVSKVAEELSPENPQAQQDFKDVKTHLAYVYFGLSQNQPWSELLVNMSPSSSITLSTFAHSHQTLIKELEDINTSISLKAVDPHIHQQCSELFVHLVQLAIKEGEQGRYHVEHSLLVLAEEFMAKYNRAAIDPNIPSDHLKKILMTMHDSVILESQEILNSGDEFYLMLGSIDLSAMSAERKSAGHVEYARRLAMQEPAILLSGALENLSANESKTIIEALARLQALPQQTDSMARIRVELVSALRFQALSKINCNLKDPLAINATWNKRLFVQQLKARLAFFHRNANFQHKRVNSHLMDLQSQVMDLKNNIAFAEEINKTFKSVPSNVLSSNLNTISLQKNLQRLNNELIKAEEQLKLFHLLLKDYNIAPAALARPVEEDLSIEIASGLKEGQAELELWLSNPFQNPARKREINKEKLTKLLVFSDEELEQQIDDLKKACRFLVQREKDLKKILPNAWEDVFD